ncbi:DUF2892 domain-containing protein [Brevibacillus humidisoli]|uniref:YgaP family membrane protein n=1 Tax=Brevibacillus humidisoli TaxID=2895522 RepID=UPI001E52D33A|nr:DUF2892 domain-containing protein [Brevibacillus humidisoli]UFJ41118.1 DUF2892 domain-containing protein [Brevibacillus humidisoli]
MRKNVGKWDRVLRVVLGILLLSMLGFVEAPWKYAAWLGIPLLLTGLLGVCFTYGILGVSTCPTNRS